MSDTPIIRDRERVHRTAEVFTPPWLVEDMLDRLEACDPTLFSEPSKTFLEPSCGEGVFLLHVLRRKAARTAQSPIPVAVMLGSLYGLDLMPDNVEVCRLNLIREAAILAGISEAEAWIEFGDTVRRNIVCHDALEWDYENWSPIPFRVSFEVVGSNQPSLFGEMGPTVTMKLNPITKKEPPPSKEDDGFLADLFGDR